LPLPGYNPVYADNSNMLWAMFKQLPKFMRTIRNEHIEVDKLLARYNFDLIISDNRYGCWSSKATSVLITHQINILLPRFAKWMEPIVRIVTKKLLRKFSVCWIPDFADDNRSFAGDLIGNRKNTSMNIKFVGPLSRFQRKETSEIKYDVVSILSGPEPQRSILEDIIKCQLEKLPLRSFVVRGIPTGTGCSKDHADFLNSEALQTVISQSSMVIARSGYSTILDLAAMGKKAIFIPTPGQTEQEYLAHRLDKKRVALKIPQQAVDIESALLQSNQYKGFTMTSNDAKGLLNKALNDVL
jgi:hypothetical protein